MKKITMKGSVSLFECDALGDEQELDLTVYFRAEKGVDHVPYGRTTASMPWLEFDGVEAYELEGIEVTYEYLVNRFSKDMVDKAVQDAEDNAEEEY